MRMLRNVWLKPKLGIPVIVSRHGQPFSCQTLFKQLARQNKFLFLFFSSDMEQKAVGDLYPCAILHTAAWTPTLRNTTPSGI